MKKVIYEPAFLILLAGNAWCIWYFTHEPNGFGNLIWIYWIQSVIIGLFNFIDLLTIRNYDVGDFKMGDKPLAESNKGCAAWFFLGHYGFFHFVYMIFLAARYHSNLNSQMILLGAAVFFLEVLMTFRQKKIIETTVRMKIGTLFFLPYVRIIPMHLTIMIPAFLHIQPTIVFVLLKTVADIIFYLITRRLYQRQLTT